MSRCCRPACAGPAPVLLCAPLLLALLLAAAALLAAGGAAAQEAGLPEPRIMIVDSQRVLREATAVQQLQAEIEAERDAFREELRQREIELREADSELTRLRPTLANEEYLARRRELEQRFARYQNESADRRRSLEGSYASGMRIVEGHLLEIVSSLAAQRKANMVLPKSSVLLADSAFEATDEVLERLNDSLPRVVPPAE